MSRLEELIQEYCPDGVEYRSLGEVCEKIHNIKWDKEKGSYRYIDLTSVDLITHNIGETKIIDAEIAPSRAQQFVQEGDVLFGTTRPTQMRVCRVNAEYDGQICSTGYCVLRPKRSAVLTNWLIHILSTEDFKAYLDVNQTRGNYPAISNKKLLQYLIPLPPLPVQEEIVRILDRFTSLTAELEAELEARKKQYEYYRKQLLGDKYKNSRNFTLGDIGSILMCKRIMKAETSPHGEVPFYKIGTFGTKPDAYITKEKYDEYSGKYSFPKKGDVLISAAGTIGRAVIYDGEPAYYQDSNIVWIDNNESVVLNKYLYYFYQTSPWTVSTGGTISRLYNDNIRKTKINIPPIPVQEEIVRILDRFDSLCNDLTSGLPAEIEARQKQYEYYRDKLLTFQPLRA